MGIRANLQIDARLVERDILAAHSTVQFVAELLSALAGPEG